MQQGPNCNKKMYIICGKIRIVCGKTICTNIDGAFYNVGKKIHDVLNFDLNCHSSWPCNAHVFIIPIII